MADTAPPDRALAARWVLTMADDAPAFVQDDHAVLLAGGRIAGVVPRAEVPAGVQVEDLGERVLLPGLVNGHGHAAMALMRGFADDMPLEPWLTQRIWPLEARWVDAAYVAEGTELAVAEMVAGGVTTFSDMYFFPEAGAAVVHRTGIRAQILAPLVKFPNAWAESPEAGFRKTTELHDEYRASTRVTIGFGPHSTYALDDDHLARIAVLSEQIEAPVQIHLHETAAEVAQARRERSERPLDTVIRTGLFGPRLQTVHMTQLEEGDPARLAEHGVSVIHCPQSNLKLASGFCPTVALRAAGVRLGLGTDGAASNNALSMFREMHVAAILAKVVNEDAAALPAREVLRMATLGGAEALGLEAETGSLEVGKAADLVAVDLSAPACTPVFHPESQLVYTGTEARVTHAWVDGEALLADGRHLGLDVEAVLARANQWRDRMLADG